MSRYNLNACKKNRSCCRHVLLIYLHRIKYIMNFDTFYYGFKFSSGLNPVWKSFQNSLRYYWMFKYKKKIITSTELFILQLMKKNINLSRFCSEISFFYHVIPCSEASWFQWKPSNFIETPVPASKPEIKNVILEMKSMGQPWHSWFIR